MMKRSQTIASKFKLRRCISGKHIVFFDPHCKFLPNVSASNPGKRIDFVANDILSQHTDQFSPFAVGPGTFLPPCLVDRARHVIFITCIHIASS